MLLQSRIHRYKHLHETFYSLFRTVSFRRWGRRRPTVHFSAKTNAKMKELGPVGGVGGGGGIRIAKGYIIDPRHLN